MGKLPPRCEGLCPSTEFDFSRFGLLLSRNCRGPVLAQEGDDSKYGVRIPLEGSAYIIPGRGIVVGEVVCRNKGLNESLDVKLDTTI